jgi:hypothetical protein
MSVEEQPGKEEAEEEGMSLYNYSWMYRMQVL